VVNSGRKGGQKRLQEDKSNGKKGGKKRGPFLCEESLSSTEDGKKGSWLQARGRKKKEKKRHLSPVKEDGI